jgi:hypothetical protein
MKIRIGGQRWSFDVVSLDDPKLQGCLGLCEPTKQAIHIADTGSFGSQLEVMCHELQHAINIAYMLPVDGREVRTGTPEEDVALVSGKGWAEMFIANPKLIDVLSKLAKKA